MFRRIKDNIVSRVSPTGQHLSSLRADLHSRLGYFRRHRSVSEQQVLTEDFNMVLAAWGIRDEADIPDILRDLRLRCLVLALPLCLAAIHAAVLRGPIAFLTLALVAPPCLLGIVTTSWRISVLKNRRFLSLSRWLLSFGGVFRL